MKELGSSNLNQSLFCFGLLTASLQNLNLLVSSFLLREFLLCKSKVNYSFDSSIKYKIKTSTSKWSEFLNKIDYI